MADINSLIAQGAQFQAPPDPFVQYGRMQQLQQGQQANALNQMKMEEAQAAAVERNALRGLDPTSADYESQLFKVNPNLGIAYRKERTTSEAQQATQQAQKAQALKTNLDNHRSFLVGVNDQPSYDAWRTLTAQNIPELASILPAQFSAEVKDSLLKKADDVSKQLTTPTPISNLARLQKELAALPPGDPMRQTYIDAIAKESQFAPTAPPAISTLAKLQREMAALPLNDPNRAAYKAMINKEINFAPSNAAQGKPPAGYRYDSSGENLEVIPGGPADKQEKLKPIPPQINTAIITNQQSIKKLDDALKLLKDYPDAVGIKGGFPQSIVNRIDEKGIPVRAAIADIGSLVLHDRSGAAVTASEEPRLLPFIPTPSDTSKSAKEKLERMLRYAKEQQDALKGTYSEDQGYRTNPILNPSNPPIPAGASVINAADAILARTNQGRR
jgi:hypothetical protein